MRLSCALVIACSLLASSLFADDSLSGPPAELKGEVAQAEKLSANGNFAGAEAAYRKLLEKAPDNVFLLYKLGGALFLERKFDAGEEVMRRAIALAPELHMDVGNAFYAGGRNEAASAAFRKAIEKDPTNAKAHNYLGIVESQMGHTGVAIAELEQAVKLDDKYGDAHFNLAVVYATQTPPDKENARKYYRRALELGSEADDALEKLIDFSPKDRTAVKDGGTGFFSLGHSSVARGFSTPELDTPGRSVLPGELRTLAPTVEDLLIQNDGEIAQKNLCEIENGTSPWLKVSDETSGKPAASGAAADNTAKLPPDVASLVADAKKQFGQGNLGLAEKLYRQALVRAPENHQILTSLGVTLFRQKKLKDAQDVFVAAIAKVPDDGFSYCTLGIIYYSQGKYDDALNTLTRAIGINEKDATAHNYLGICSSVKGMHGVALKELETATTLDPKYADAHFNLAVVLATQAPVDIDKAREHYQRAIALGAERDLALEKLVGPPSSGAPATKSGVERPSGPKSSAVPMRSLRGAAA